MEEAKDQTAKTLKKLAKEVVQPTSSIQEKDVEFDKNNPEHGTYRGICILTDSKGGNTFSLTLEAPPVHRSTANSEWGLDYEDAKKILPSVKLEKFEEQQWKPLTSEELAKRTIAKHVQVDTDNLLMGRYIGTFVLRSDYEPKEGSLTEMTYTVKNPKVVRDNEYANWQPDYNALPEGFREVDWHLDSWNPAIDKK
tara:strand:- start:198 stop:785 length:588 start_codon:yes stop_codon:yes gene_type:complete